MQGDILVAPIATTLQLGQLFAHIYIFDPLTGTSSIQDFTNTSSISLQVVDHPLIIQLSQNQTFQAASNIIAAPDQIITNPLQPVQVDGLSVASGLGTIAVQLQSTASALSILDTAGHLLATQSNAITLTGSLSTINAELATVTYTGGSALGNDVITITTTDQSGTSSTRNVAVLVEAGTTAIDSGGPAVSMPASFSSAAAATSVLPRFSAADTYAATHSGTVTLTAHAAAGVLQIPSAIGQVSGNQSSSLSLSGSFSQVVAALGALSYTAPGQPMQDSITIEVTDQAGFSSTGITSVTVSAAAATPVPPPVARPTVVIPTVIIPATTAVISAPTVTAIIAAPVVTPPSPSASSDPAVYRFFDSSSGTQFLTSSPAERDAIVAMRPDLVAEGVGIRSIAQPATDANAIAVYRFSDVQSGTHFYTSSSSERDSLEADRSDLKFEGASFYEHQSAGAGDTAVYRFFNATNGTHFYTANPTERATILSSRADLVLEGVAFYAPSS